MNLTRKTINLSLRSAYGNEKGIVLAVVLMFLAILAAMGSSAVVMTRAEIKVGGNDNSSKTSFYAAEAGLNHAKHEVSDGDGTNDFDTIHASSPGTVVVSNPSFSDASYTVTLLESLNTPPGIRVASIGNGPSNSASRLEMEISRVMGSAPKAINTNGDLMIGGSPNILGTLGGAHSNDDIMLSGSIGAQMLDGITASDSFVTAGGLEYSGIEISGNPCIGSPDCANNPADPEYVLDTNEKKDEYESNHSSASSYTMPEINPANYASAVASAGGFILREDCTVVTGADAQFSGGLNFAGGTFVSPPSGWTCSSGTWEVSGDSVVDGIFYAEGRVNVSGNPGSQTTPWQTTIVARDTITFSGNPSIQPYPTTSWELQNILLVTGNDLEISGMPTASGYEGALLAHQQVKINGNPVIDGFVLATDGMPSWSGDPFTDRSLGVTMNEIPGNPTITYNGDFGISVLGSLTVTSWYHSY